MKSGSCPRNAVKTMVKHGQDQVKTQGPRLKTILVETLPSGLAGKAPTWGGRIKALVAVSRLGPATQKYALVKNLPLCVPLWMDVRGI